MDLAALLALSERASDEGAQVLVVPSVPGLFSNDQLAAAFARNVEERVRGLVVLPPAVTHRAGDDIATRPTSLGRTIVLEGDACVDADRFAAIQAATPDTVVWLFNAEDELQAEAMLELALDASTTLAPLVIIAAATGEGRALSFAGTSAVVHLGEIVAEGGRGEDLVLADVRVPSMLSEHARRLPEPAPVLVQRLAAHRHEKAPVDYPADLS